MSIRVGIDLDGVLIKNDSYWGAYFAQHDAAHKHIWPTDTPLYTPNRWDYWKSICTHCYGHILGDPEMHLSYEPRPGSLLALAVLASNFTLYAVTSRSPKVEAATLRWMQKYRLLDIFADVVFTTDKAKTSDDMSLSFLVDDAPGNYEALASRRCTCVLFDAPYNRHIENALRADDWSQVVAFLYAAMVNVQTAAEEQLPWMAGPMGKA